MRTHSITLAVFTTLLLVSSVFSWGEVGHLLVTQITEYDLKARGHEDVFQKATDIILQGKELSPKMTWTFEGGSIYADELKFVQKIDVFDEMHYFDMILNPNGISIRQAAEQPNALSFIYKTIDSFKAKKTNNYTWTDTFLLRMLTHIVGDMHQPLHMTTLYSEEFVSGDQGGNKFKIHYSNTTEEEAENLGLPTNLHAYWDQGAGIFPSFPIRPLPKDNQTWVQNYAQEMYKNYTREAFKQELLEKNVTKWGKAVFNISRDTVYPPLMNNAHTITPNYTNTMYPIMLKMITLAGYRLSDILVDLFGSKHGTTEERVQRATHHYLRKGFLPEKIRQSQSRN